MKVSRRSCRCCLHARARLRGDRAAAPDGTLINAAENKQHDAALKLLAGGADAKAKDVDSTTALHWAAHYA